MDESETVIRCCQASQTEAQLPASFGAGERYSRLKPRPRPLARNRGRVLSLSLGEPRSRCPLLMSADTRCANARTTHVSSTVHHRPPSLSAKRGPAYEGASELTPAVGVQLCHAPFIISSSPSSKKAPLTCASAALLLPSRSRNERRAAGGGGPPADCSRC